MTLRPIQRFLGLDDKADPRRLLGLPPAPKAVSAAEIKAALEARLALVEEHPDGAGADAQFVCTALRSAAARLAKRAGPSRPAGAVPVAPIRPGSPEALARPRRPRPDDGNGAPLLQPARQPPPALTLTAFDRQVLGVLIGSRGWNAASRSRLVALASLYGVSVQGLLKVVTGLSEYAKHGGPGLGVQAITSGGQRLVASAPVTATVSPAVASAIVRRLGEQIGGDRPWVRTRLSIIFGALTIALGVTAMWLILSGDPETTPTAATPSAAPVPLAPTTPQTAAPDPIGPDPVLARFRPMPTFLGNGMPEAGADAADRCRQLPAELELIVRKLRVSTDAALPVLKGWEESVSTMSTGWVLSDDSTRGEVRGLLLDALYLAADTPDDSDRLLLAFTPPIAPLAEPVDIWRGAWLAGMLGMIAGNGDLPPVVTDQARRQLDSALRLEEGGAPTDFTGAAAAWLDSLVPWLVQIIEFDDSAYDLWELWLSAERVLGPRQRVQQVLMLALGSLMRTGTDLSRPGPTINVIGRIVQLSAFTDSPVVRREVLALFDDQAVTATDLWVLTSLMASHDRVPWFHEQLVSPPDAGPVMRRRVRDRISARWEQVAAPTAPRLARGHGVAVDAAVLARWQWLRRQAQRSTMDLMEQLIVAARLNTAAALLASNQVADAEDLLQDIEIDAGLSTTSPPAPAPGGTVTRPGMSPGRGPGPGGRSRQPSGSPAPSRPARQPGQPIGPDGQWSAQYEQARRNIDEKLKWLQALGRTAGTDLGPIDAAVLAREAFRGSPQDVRATAQWVILDSFADGPNLVLAVLDMLPDAQRSDDDADFIMQLTDQLLPPPRSEAWPLEARLALVRHALSLRGGAAVELDEQASLVAETYLERARLVHRGDEGLLTLALSTPRDAATVLRDRWRRRAASMMAAAPVPDDLEGLDRRHASRLRLARGPIQQFVARQVSIVDLLAFVTAAEQPVLRAQVLEVLREARSDRLQAHGVLAQSVVAEKTLSRIWSLRMEPPSADIQQPEQGP
jgi:hypothetical protein